MILTIILSGILTGAGKWLRRRFSPKSISFCLTAVIYLNCTVMMLALATGNSAFTGQLFSDLIYSFGVVSFYWAFSTFPANSIRAWAALGPNILVVILAAVGSTIFSAQELGWALLSIYPLILSLVTIPTGIWMAVWTVKYGSTLHDQRPNAHHTLCT